MAGIQTGIELHDGISDVLSHIINSVSMAVHEMEAMQQTMSQPVDTTALENVRNEVDAATIAYNELADAMERMQNTPVEVPDVQPVNPAVQNTAPYPTAPQTRIPETPSGQGQSRAPPEPVQVPVEWDTSGILDVFTGTGIERFEQEIQSANAMLEGLGVTQRAITAQASGMDLFPSEATADLQGLMARMDALRGKIAQIGGNPLNLGTGEANAGLESLRGQISQAMQAQERLNAAVAAMDVGEANAAYIELAQTVGNTERYIRDNTTEQGVFNTTIAQGADQASRLTGLIARAVGAYVGIQGIKKVLDLSDSLAQTTSRLNLMNNAFNEINDTALETPEVVRMTYAAAQDARGSFEDMADVVARFGNNARDAFGSQEEVVAFAGLIQKQMTIAGASTQEAANAQLQLSQALGSGVLRGDELNSIFEQAPNLIQNIADYLDVPIGKIREMAADGELSAGVVKMAIFDAADEINEEFEAMPMTWSQVWTSMQNSALMAFQPVLQKINDLANSDAIQTFSDGAVRALSILAGIALHTFDLLAGMAGFVSENWAVIEPIVIGIAAALGLYTAALVANNVAQGIGNVLKAVAALQESAHAAALAMESGATFTATAAQYGFNAALLACPLTWMILKIIALVAIIYAVCTAIAQATGAAQSGFGIIAGTVAVAVSVILNLIIGLINTAIGWVVNFHNLVANFAAAFGVLFDDPVAAIKATILSMFNYIVGVVGKAASILDAVFGSKLAETVSGFQEKIQSEIDTTIEGAGGEAAKTLHAEDYQLDRIGYGDAFERGAAWGDHAAESVADGISGFFDGLGTEIPNVDDYTGGLSDAIAGAQPIGEIADNTDKTAKTLSDTEEDLKYLRDLAEQEAVNRFTTAEIKLEMTNNNNINSDLDLDGVVAYMTEAVEEAVETMAEGVHA